MRNYEALKNKSIEIFKRRINLNKEKLKKMQKLKYRKCVIFQGILYRIRTLLRLLLIFIISYLTILIFIKTVNNQILSSNLYIEALYFLECICIMLSFLIDNIIEHKIKKLSIELILIKNKYKELLG